MRAIVDGGQVNTCPEIEFPDIDRPNSPAEVLSNLLTWLDASLAVDPWRGKTATQLEANMIRRDTLLDVKNWLTRLEAWRWE